MKFQAELTVDVLTLLETGWNYHEEHDIFHWIPTYGREKIIQKEKQLESVRTLRIFIRVKVFYFQNGHNF